MKHFSAVSFALVLLLTGTLQGAAQQAPAGQADEASPIALNIDNTDIYQVIDIIAGALNLNYVVDPAVKGTVNLHTGTTLRRSDLLPILETILKINGATMIQSGNFYQIVPSSTAVRQPLSLQGASTIAPDDQMVIQVVRMKFVAAGEMERLLTPYLSDGGNITVNTAGNILLVGDRRSNLRKLMEIVNVFDSSEFEGQRVRLLPVKYSAARDLVEELKTIFSGYALSDKATAIRFVAMERTNEVLVVTPNPDVFPVIEKWITQLDQPLSAAGLRTFIYKAKYSRAIDLQNVLSQLYSSGINVTFGAQNLTPSASGPAPPNQQPVPTAGNPLPVPALPGTAVPTASTAAQSTSTGVRIIADEVNNALLIQATPPVYADIEMALRELDVQRRQVLIDAQIFEVALDDSTSFGISAILQNRGTLERSTTGSFATPQGGTAPSLSVQTFTTIGRTRELILFLNAQENRSRIRTLSAPSVLVTDNQEALFQVGAEVPVPVSSSVTPVQSDGTNLFAQTIQFRNTGVILKVKPQVNDSGGITLDVAQEVSQAGANTTSGIVAPVIGKSSVTSTIVIDNGQTIALGGFIRENHETDKNRIPVLGRIPVFGALFGSTTRGHTRTELIILITPHVLRNRNDADLATQDLRAKLKEIQGSFK
jgi:general secretion pathway protein D